MVNKKWMDVWTTYDHSKIQQRPYFHSQRQPYIDVDIRRWYRVLHFFAKTSS